MLQFFVRIVVYIVTLDTIHTVRRYGARRYFSMDQLHAHRKKKNLREKPQEGLFWPLIPKSEASYKTKKKLSKLRAHAMFVEQTSAMNDERLLHRTQRNP